ncbi:MAG: hypothetical protein IKO02_06440, partial [Lentisphaeria bacterium]|nr:hypothetical protein [Lentisphaeria bacterium]
MSRIPGWIQTAFYYNSEKNVIISFRNLKSRRKEVILIGESGKKAMLVVNSWNIVRGPTLHTKQEKTMRKETISGTFTGLEWTPVRS